ncbi:MAG TPA: hypothetical protein ENI46_01370 [Firmicutes bacterium]|nr:hypothetical protein [Bacillota bacterium]
MRTLCHFFNTDRMVKEYARKFYLPVIDEFEALKECDFEEIRDWVSWIERLREQWNGIDIAEIHAEITGDERVGSRIPVWAKVNLGGLDPNDVTVEVYFGQVDHSGRITSADLIEMLPESQVDGLYVYRTVIPCKEGGNQGLTVRIIPSRSRAKQPLQLGLIKWARL